MLTNSAMSPLFEAVIEATGEAIYYSMFKADGTTGEGHRVKALSIRKTVEISNNHNVTK